MSYVRFEERRCSRLARSGITNHAVTNAPNATTSATVAAGLLSVTTCVISMRSSDIPTANGIIATAINVEPSSEKRRDTTPRSAMR